MIVFCEDCGCRIDLPDTASRPASGYYTCSNCNDSQTCDRYGENAVALVNDSPAAGAAPVRVMMVDDSKLIRTALRRVLAEDGRIQLVGEAADGSRALELLPRLAPDVVTLDINMPVMDGLTTLKHIMIKQPLPLVMLSTLTHEGATETFDALKLGAVDFMQKPSRMSGSDFGRQKRRIVDKIVMAAGVKIDRIQVLPTRRRERSAKNLAEAGAQRVIGVCAAEGGYRSLLQMIPMLPATVDAAIVVVLYAERTHIAAFAAYLDGCSVVRVERGVNGQALQSGHCYLVAGNEYATIAGTAGRLTLTVHDNPFPDQRGAANMLMISLAGVLDHRAGGVVLSGLGRDGVEGLQEIRRVGGLVLVQSPPTCLHREMPQRALLAGVAETATPGGHIAEAIVQHWPRQARQAS